MADFSAIRKEECRESKLPNGCELNGSHTVVLQSVINEIKEHGRSSMHAEVCGVLVGSLCWDGGPYLLIDGRIEGKHASHQSGSVTFTSETWDFIHEELAAKYPDRKIVGWYHTHPGFGIFLSNMDAFIHENFFSFPWEPAYVFDPQAETDGFFFRIGTELVQETVCISGDVAPSVKGPVVGFLDPGKIVINDKPKRCYVLLSIAAAVVVCCCVVVGMFFMKKFRDTEQAANAAETKAEALRGALVEKNTEIERHKQKANEWSVRNATYEKELEGLRIKVTTYERELEGLQIRMTTIKAERKALEASNKDQQTTVDRLKSDRSNLEKSIHELEMQISNTKVEVDQVNSKLASAHEQIRRLEHRNKELEASALGSEKMDGGPHCNETTPVPAKSVEITIKDDDQPWYYCFKFW